MSQDLIVTLRGDSLQVRLHEGGASTIQFDYTDQFRTTVRELPRNQIKSLIQGYYTNLDRLKQERVEAAAARDTVQVPVVRNTHVAIAEATDLEEAFLDTIKISTPYRPDWYIGGYGGVSKRLFGPKIGLNQAELDYLQKLKTGYSLGFTGAYYFKKRWGAGLRYDVYLSNARKSEDLLNRVRIQFVGLSILHRVPVQNLEAYVQTGFELGYQPYVNRPITREVATTLRSKTLGWGVSVGYFQPLSSHLILSLTGSCYVGSSYKMLSSSRGKSQTIQLNRHNFEDLTRASLTLGLAFTTIR